LVFTCVRCGCCYGGNGSKLKINGEDVHPKEEYCETCRFQVTAVLEFGLWCKKPEVLERQMMKNVRVIGNGRNGISEIR
jgi:hypothetical protein